VKAIYELSFPFLSFAMSYWAAAYLTTDRNLIFWIVVIFMAYGIRNFQSRYTTELQKIRSERTNRVNQALRTELYEQQAREAQEEGINRQNA